MTIKKRDDMDVGKAFEELDELARWFESGKPDLDVGIEKFERAMALSKVLKDRLAHAENKLKEIRLKNSD